MPVFEKSREPPEVAILTLSLVKFIFIASKAPLEVPCIPPVALEGSYNENTCLLAALLGATVTAYRIQ